MMGVKKLIGSDISGKAIADTKINLEWLKKNGQLRDGNWDLIELSATEISKKIAPASVDAIVTEPYLGPQRGANDIPKIAAELEKLYSAALVEFKKILKSDGHIVMVFPAFAFGRRPDLTFINPNLNGYQIIETLPANLKNSLRTTGRGTLIYGRPEQKVWREIVCLKLSSN
jgi:tRNA G10  N-methylase Trm11